MNAQNTLPEVRLSCRLELLPGEGPVSKIAHAREFGFDAVALPGRYLNDYIGDLKAHAGALPLPLSALSLGFRGSLVSPSAEIRRECFRNLIALFDLCADMKIPFLNMPPSLMQDNPQRSSSVSEQDAWLLEQLPALTQEAARRSVTILIEPVNRYESDYLNTMSHAIALCEEAACSNLGVTADLFHMQLEERRTAESLRAAGKWIRLVHVAENNRQEPGSGSMDFLSAFSALKRIGYTGFLELESRSLSGPAQETLPASVRYLRERWNSAGP